MLVEDGIPLLYRLASLAFRNNSLSSAYSPLITHQSTVVYSVHKLFLLTRAACTEYPFLPVAKSLISQKVPISDAADEVGNLSPFIGLIIGFNYFVFFNFSFLL